MVRDEIIIEAGRTEANYWRDLWRYRELFYFLAWRDILVRYKQTAIGVAWALIRPFLTMLILTVVFNKVAGSVERRRRPISSLGVCGLVALAVLFQALSESSGSLIGNANLVSKVYFPRLIVPGGAVVTAFVDFIIILVMMAALMLWYGFAPDWRVAFLPLFVAVAFASALGAGLWLCALTVKYRDFRYVIPFIVQFGLYVSPVGFSSDKIPETWRLLYSANPMVGVIDGFRWALLRGESALWWPGTVASLITTSLCCAAGIWYFRRTEKHFADII